MSDSTNRDQLEAYPWDTVRTDCWSQVRSVFREEGPQGELAVFYRAAPVDNARRLDEEQIQCLRDELLTLRATCHRLQVEQEQLQKENDELRARVESLTAGAAATGSTASSNQPSPSLTDEPDVDPSWLPRVL